MEFDIAMGMANGSAPEEAGNARTADGATPRRASLARSRSRPRARRLWTVPTGHPS